MSDITPQLFIRQFLESGVAATARTNIGLGNVDDTSDLNKPTSNATQAQIDPLDASITALEDRDWVEVSLGSIINSDPPSIYDSDVLYVMEATSLNGYPTPSGTLFTECRARRNDNFITQTFNGIVGNTHDVYTRKGLASGTWTPWQKIIQSENGIITDGLELSGIVTTTGNDLLDPDQVINVGQADAKYATQSQLDESAEVETYNVVTTSGNIDQQYRNHFADPSLGDIELTLPDSQLADNLGRVVTVKRVTNGGNICKLVSLPGDSIDIYTSSVIFSNLNEYASYQAVDGLGWQTLNKHLTAYAAMAVATPVTFSATTGFTKLDSWDLVTFQTNQKFEANLSTSTLDVLHHTGSAYDAFAIACSISIEGLKDKYLEAQIYDGTGAPLSPFVAVNGLGAGKPITITLTAEVLMSAVGTIEVRLLSESAQIVTISAASIVGNRING